MATLTQPTVNPSGSNPLDPNNAKKPPVLPYQQPGKTLQLVQPSTNPFTQNGQAFSFMQPNQGVPQINPANVQPMQSGYSPDAANQQVLATAQNKAIQGFQSPTMDMTSKLTQQLLQDPSQGFNPQQNVQRGMEQFDLQRSQGMEAARQALAPVMNTGAARGDFMDLAIQNAQGRAAFQSDAEAKARAEQQNNLFKALAEGRATGEQERLRFDTDIGALATIRGAAEGQENRNFQQSESALDRGLQVAMANQDAALQTSLTELKGKIDQGLLLTQQDFQGAQADIDRQLQQSIASGNWQNAIQLQQLKAEFEAQQASADREFSRAERVASQTWSSSERVSTQDFQTTQKYLDHQLAEARATNDLQRQEYLLDKQAQIDLKMQTNGFDQQTKMAYLENQLAEAKANNDVGRQQQILSFQHNQTIDLMQREQGFSAAQDYIQQQHQLAMQGNDIAAQKAIQQASIEASAREAALDREHSVTMMQAQQAFAEKGIAMETIMANLENMDPNQAAQYVWDMANQNGIDIGPNPAHVQEINAIRNDESLFTTDEAKRNAWIQRAGQLGYNPQQAIELWNYQNENAVDSGFVTEKASVIRNGGYKNVGDVKWDSEEGEAIYQALISDTTIPNGYGSKTVFKIGGVANDYRGYTNLENAYTNGEPVKINGEIYIVTGVSNIDKLGADHRTYTLQNLRTGETMNERAQ